MPLFNLAFLNTQKMGVHGRVINVVDFKPLAPSQLWVRIPQETLESFMLGKYPRQWCCSCSRS
jgi:hypothetical protein